MEHPIIEIELERCRAFERADWDLVESMLDKQLIYIHAPGFIHGKMELMAFLRGGVRYEAMERTDLQVHEHDGVVWTTGLMRIKGVRSTSDATFEATSFVTQIWIQKESVWSLVLLQSTKV